MPWLLVVLPILVNFKSLVILKIASRRLSTPVLEKLVTKILRFLDKASLTKKDRVFVFPVPGGPWIRWKYFDLKDS